MRALQQPLEGVKAIGGLAVGAIMTFIVYMFANQLLPEAADGAPGGQGGMIANQWINTGLDTVLPLLFLLLVFFGLVSKAVMSRRYR